ncbi:MAG: TetR/AcrR family transcriptional regulator [Actinomycetota bacterium]|nr:TetR/AcrR family transcriptional regulator [Actinomycetota bacterium]
MKNKKFILKKDNSKSKLDTRERIIKTTLNIIGEKGDVNPTVRDIARKAQVNLASINYYFRSKKKLFNEIEEYFAGEISKITVILDDTSMDAVTRILTWAKKLMDNLANYPGIMLLLASRVMKKDKIERTIIKFIDIRNSSFKRLVGEITRIEDDKLVDLKAIQIFSGIINPLIIQYGVGKVFNVDFNDSRVRERYIETLIKSILGI